MTTKHMIYIVFKSESVLLHPLSLIMRKILTQFYVGANVVLCPEKYGKFVLLCGVLVITAAGLSDFSPKAVSPVKLDKIHDVSKVNSLKLNPKVYYDQ